MIGIWRRMAMVLAGALILAGCDNPQVTFVGAQRLVLANQVQPFALRPAVSIVTQNTDGSLLAFTLVSCGTGVVCLDHAGGRRARITRNSRETVIFGPYRGRSFHLSPGGDGYMLVDGVRIALAWE